jgi:hypothetical protein
MKTLEQIKTAADRYITKTSNHLFKLGEGHYFKVEKLSCDGKNYYATIHIKEDKVVISVQEIMSEGLFKLYGNNSLSVLKHGIFGWYKPTNVSYFRKMRNFVTKLKTEISLDNKVNQELSYNYLDEVKEVITR